MGIFEKFESQFIKNSFSQSGEDLIVKFIFDTLKIDTPTYIDIGAHHPFFINNTALFYMNGCKGINIEPDPDKIKLFHKYRKNDIILNVGIADREGFMDYYRFSSPTLNCFVDSDAIKYQQAGHELKEVVKIKVETLPTIIQRYANNVFPDFLSLDAEGMDEQILTMIDYELNAPAVICVETLLYSEYKKGTKNQNIISFLQEKGYFVYADTYINTIFVRRDTWRNQK
jgi:FkbM family methyltransferase